MQFTMRLEQEIVNKKRIDTEKDKKKIKQKTEAILKKKKKLVYGHAVEEMENTKINKKKP